MTIQRDHRLTILALKKYGPSVPMTFELAPETTTDIVTGKQATAVIEIKVRKALWCDASVMAAFKLPDRPEAGFRKGYKRVIVDRRDLPSVYQARLMDSEDLNTRIIIDGIRYRVSNIVPHPCAQIVEYYVEAL